MIFCTYFNIQKQFEVSILDFKFEIQYFGYSFGYVHNNWAIFFNLLVTLSLTNLFSSDP
jgi:hypothetical protein